jgi:hypothetical protein
MHIFEIMRPNRGMDKLENELTNDLKAILNKRRDEAEGKCILDEPGFQLVSGKGKIVSTAKVTCPKLDAMRYLEVRPYRKVLFGNAYNCNKCKQNIDLKKGFYNCMKCRYDLCLECSGHNESIRE